jgi:peptide deformylase
MEYDSKNILDLVPSDDPILREEMPEFDFLNPPIDPIELAHILSQNCLYHDGLGLSSPQIGLRYRACVVKANPMICMINPRILAEGEESYALEGCLSFPNLVIKIKRPEVIRVRYTQPNGETITKQYGGMTARCMYHEIDHLDGILFMDRATLYHLEIARKHKKKILRDAKRGGDLKWVREDQNERKQNLTG